MRIRSTPWLVLCLAVCPQAGSAQDVKPPLASPPSPPACQPDAAPCVAPGPEVDGGCCDGWGLGRSCPYPPGRVWADAEYLLWWTKGSPLPPLLTTSPPGTPIDTAGLLGANGTTVLFGNERVNTDARSGGRFTAGAWLNEGHTTGIEASFFFLGDETSHFTAVSDGSVILARPFIDFNPTSPFFGQGNTVLIAFPGLVRGSFEATTTSELRGAEVYLRQSLCCGCCCRLDALVGYRYLRLREGLHISETEIATGADNPLAGIPFLVNEGFDTTNNFHGGELGLIGEVQRGRWFLRARGKLALGTTSQTVRIQGTTQVDSAAPEAGGILALPSNSGDHHSSHFSVVPEVGADIGFVVTPNVRVFTGYTFLYWTHVARPGDQVDLRINTTQPPLGNALIGPAVPAFNLKESSFWAQGLNFGLDIRF